MMCRHHDNASQGISAALEALWAPPIHLSLLANPWQPDLFTVSMFLSLPHVI